MHDLDDEDVMTGFLLGALDDTDTDRVADRLANDADYFEAMAALDDDVILRWHHGQLSDEKKPLFARAYLSAPARRVRIDASLALLEAAQTWNAHQRASWGKRIISWLAAPSKAPRFAFVTTGALLAAALSLSGFVVDRTVRRAHHARGTSGGQVAVEFEALNGATVAQPGLCGDPTATAAMVTLRMAAGAL